MQAQREKIAKSAVAIIVQDGFYGDVLQKASLEAGFDENLGDLLFINGVLDLIAFYFEQEREYIRAQLVNKPINGVGLTVQKTLEGAISYWHTRKELMRKMQSFLSLPWNLPNKVKTYWKFSDFVWSEILRDGATDFNYYSKRSILSGVYASVLLHLLRDKSADASDTVEFMQRQLKRVHAFGKLVQPLKKRFG